jgi:cellulose synthase/poly-beta-1,6-N-acetylglucosamine synthase-like glycosyltransferase
MLRKNDKKDLYSPEYTPKISVVIPANNQAQELYNNIETILKQDYPNFEVVIVDESENTETKEFVEKLQKKYKNLRKTFVPQTFRNICKRKFSISYRTY